MSRLFSVLFSLLLGFPAFGATIAIIDTGFDLDHDFLKPKIFKSETDEEAQNSELIKEFHGWNFFDNSHLKKPVIEDQSDLQEVLLFRNLRAKGHREGLSFQEFEWFKKKSSDKDFMELVKKFKKHSHGTFVAGIALREGENINIFPIRGLSIPSPVIVVEDSTPAGSAPVRGKTSEEKFQEEIKNSIDRVSRKFSKICHYLSIKNVEVVNASYGITYKNIMTRFREKYKEVTNKEIDEPKLLEYVNMYFDTLYRRGIRTVKRYPRMLFVFSAGNSGLDNDQFHHYPSRIRLPNTITVAAMNGDYLASFSNYGLTNVDIAAPGVAILSLVPKVYSTDGKDIYSPASGTSMAAPYISNLAAQILNTNSKLKPEDVKQIILETGDEKLPLKGKLASGAAADNAKALKAALLSRDMNLTEAITLANLNLIPMEDKISIGQPPAVSVEGLQKKVMDSIPHPVAPHEVDEEPTVEEVKTPVKAVAPVTKPESSSQKDPEKAPQDNSDPLPSEPTSDQPKTSDPVQPSQTSEQSPTPSEELPASSSESQPKLPEAPVQESAPSSP